MNKHCLLVFFFLFCTSLFSFAQNTSNKGKDFYVPYAGHIDGNNSRLTLFLSADQATDYKVYIGGVLVSQVGATIPANTCIPFVINPNVYNVLMSSSNVAESNKAINVVTSKAISLYSIISNNARTGGTLVLPTNTLGQEYYTFSYENHGNQQGFSQFTIVATADSTDVEITAKQNERNGRRNANTTFTIRLNKGDIYQYQSIGDLTGSHIKALNCNPIAVFSGNTWAAFCNEGNNRAPNGGDNLYQQVFPVSAWGKNFVTAPFYNTLNGNTDIMRIIVAEDNTTLTVNGKTASANGTTLSNPYSKGSVVTFFSTTANVISGSKPISVAQYQTSQTCNPNNAQDTRLGGSFLGDPEITVLNPVEQTLNNITVFSDLKSVGVPTQISKYYLNVIIKTKDVASFRLDGNPVNNFFAIDNEFSYAVIDVTDTQPQHRLSAAGGFSAISYGYGSVESYAYLAGANIQNFTFQPTSTATGQAITSGCLGEPISLSINLPYKATKLDWEIQGAPRVIDPNPKAVNFFTRPNDNNTYYTYKYPDSLNYPNAGDYQFKVVATKPTADNCGNVEELIIDFSVDNQPTAAFQYPDTGCQLSGVQFTDKSKSNSNSRSITQWLWDFGDGSAPSTEQHPVHIYDRPGTYNVILTVTTDSKCSATSAAFPIVINPKPLSDFEVTSLCVGKPIILTENSKIDDSGRIVKWTWNFGDGSLPSSEQHPIHQYTATGSYTITLTTESDKGCVSETKSKNVTVINPQSADFELPDFCLADGVARFKNTSKNADGSTTGLTAQWTFTYDGSTVATSNDFDGSFSPIDTGNYSVALIVKNGAGCEMSKTRTFTVNGAVRAADFDIVKNNVCVSDKIVIKNTSTTFAGRITKIEIYRDYPNETSIYKTIPYPDNSDIEIQYNSFGGISDRSFNVRLVAYSGEQCVKEVMKRVTLKPVPQLVFDDMPAVCEADGTVLIVQARQKSGEELAGGSGEYSGDGIKADGTFNPKAVGVGSHIITYTFKGTNECSSSVSKAIEVYASPVANAGTLIYVLAGGQIEIPATAEGTNLKYLWSPAIGLNRTDVLKPIASPDKDTEYTLTATTQPDGCSTTSKVLVKVLQALNPPNSFTPNGDNVNDTWIIKYLESYPNATVDIFNRNGLKVFSSRGYKVPFDGTYQNEPLPVGVYYYIINPQNGRKTITGPLTIIR